MKVRVIAAGALVYKNSASPSRTYRAKDGAFEMDDVSAKDLIERGIVEAVEQTVRPKPMSITLPVYEPFENKPETDGVDLASLTRAELIAYAEEKGIDVAGLRSKKDILTAIEAADDDNFDAGAMVE